MHLPFRSYLKQPQKLLLAVTLICAASAAIAQDKDFKLEVHATSQATAKDVGLPAYPDAIIDKGSEDNSNADFGFAFGNTRFRMIVAKYSTTDLPDQVLAFYRKHLSRFGGVLECNHGKPVGAPPVKQSGLTCSGQKNDDAPYAGETANDDQHELRAGSPGQLHIVSIDETHSKSTRFVLVFVESPKESPR